MLQVFLSLSFFTTNFSVDSNEYFKYFPDFKYGFRKNAEIKFIINSTSTGMVFGLATDKELNKIKTKSTTIEYCEGKTPLSAIQFFVDNETTYSGKIPQKEYLTPYSFGCSTKYDFSIYLEYKNCKKHSDYRIQEATIYTFIFSVFYFILEIFFIIKYRHQKYHWYLDVFYINNILYFLFNALYFLVIRNKEFSDKTYIFSKLFNIIAYNDLLGLTYSLSIFQNFTFNINIMNRVAINTFALLAEIALLFFCYYYRIYISYYFVRHCFYLFICIIQFGILSNISFFKIGIMIFFIGNYFVFAFEDIFLYYTKNYSYIVFLLIHLNIFSFVVNVIASVFLLIGFIYFDDINIVNVTPLRTSIPHLDYAELN